MCSCSRVTVTVSPMVSPRAPCLLKDYHINSTKLGPAVPTGLRNPIPPTRNCSSFLARQTGDRGYKPHSKCSPFLSVGVTASVLGVLQVLGDRGVTGCLFRGAASVVFSKDGSSKHERIAPLSQARRVAMLPILERWCNSLCPRCRSGRGWDLG